MIQNIITKDDNQLVEFLKEGKRRQAKRPIKACH
jgi:hypothetical protein